MHLSRRTVIEWTLSIGALAVVAVAIVGMDARVRDYARGAIARGQVDWRAPQAVTDLARTAWDLCMDHQPLAAFAAVGLMLLLFMRRMR